MKKNFLLLIILFAFHSVNAQNETDANPYQKNNEIKLNALNPLFGSLEAGYERYLNHNSSLGISFFKVFDNTKNKKDLNYSITPYYRRYFGKKFASGFFAEGFGMLSSIDGKKIYDVNDNSKFTEGSDVIDLSLGLGLGNKWVTKSGFTFEVNLGWGKQLFNSDKTDHDQIVRFGVHVGYRF
ncbi:DUF3575 domain-containing protein [Flavobacterium sp. '19STA2R22 D10 B1']|uniref:DUF3575 domain-containing protein n=1 Tax=Flavobacterium aerium TaxID=3037261 RepID=UPI00278BF3F0|nr:DUF3575 domain-containing protein [Flavobacterium sp. '19STA2R22 D10 B1']